MSLASADSVPPPVGDPPPVPWAWAAKLALAGLFLVAGLDLFGRSYLRMFRPPDGLTADFIQEWLSVRNYFSGHPIYESQFESGPRHMPNHVGPVTHLKYNAHPPGSVLLALPFAGLGYQDAHLVWNLATVPLFLLAVALAVRELCDPFRWWHLLPLAAVLVCADPVLATVSYGQLNFVLVFLLTAGWVCDRRGHPVAAGVFVGLAAGVKLFPAFVFVYFLFGGRRRGLVAGGVTAVAVNAAALAVFGVGAFRDYVRDVMPTLELWGGAWQNVSLNGLWSRAVAPPVADTMRPGGSLLAKAGSGVFFLIVTAAVAWAAVRARRAGDPDLGWAAAVAALPLVSPIAWQHYYVLHVVPLAVLAARLDGWRRYAGWVATGGAVAWDYLYLVLFVSKAHRAQSDATPTYFIPLSPAENLLGTGLVTACGVVLFLLAVTLPRHRARPRLAETPALPTPS